MFGEFGGLVQTVLADGVIVDVILECEFDGLAHLVDIIGVELSADISYDFGSGSGIGAGHGGSAGHGFERGQAEAFVEAGQNG